MSRRFWYFLAAAAMAVSCSDSNSAGGGADTQHGSNEPQACTKNSSCPISGQLCCGEQCIDVKSNPDHCGKCNNKCTSGVCTDGVCGGTCTGENKKACGGKCVDVSSDNNNCGSCGHVCGDHMTCNDKTCECMNDYKDCDGDIRNGCETYGDYCSCNVGEVSECYMFSGGRPGVGICKSGTHTCIGSDYDECVGGVGPIEEIIGNNIDDDCDGEIDEASPTVIVETPSCSDQPFYPADNATITDADALKLAQAMDICTTAARDGYGLISAQLLHADGSALESAPISGICGSNTTLISPAQQIGVTTKFGNLISPVKHETMAILSSGKASGSENTSDKDCMGSEVSAPAEFLAAHGGHLPASCGTASSQGTKANDSVMLRLKLKAPSAAKGFKFRFKFFSKEYPDFVCDNYNDFFLALVAAKSSEIPNDHNVSFDSKGNPVSVNNAFFTECVESACTKPTGCSTCENGSDNVKAYVSNPSKAGATSWLYTSVPVEPSETFTLDLVIFDAGEKFDSNGKPVVTSSGFGHQKDSLVLLDAFEWLADETQIITEVN